MTRFLPVKDALKLSRKKIRRQLENFGGDTENGIYIGNTELYCKKCGDSIAKYEPCYVGFRFFPQGKGAWTISQVLCLNCASKISHRESRVKPRDRKRSTEKHFKF